MYFIQGTIQMELFNFKIWFWPISREIVRRMIFVNQVCWRMLKTIGKSFLLNNRFIVHKFLIPMLNIGEFIAICSMSYFFLSKQKIPEYKNDLFVIAHQFNRFL